MPTLDALVQAGYEVAIVVTRPDARRGRRGEPEPSPVKAAALGHGLTVAHDVDAVLDAAVDLAVVVAYGRLVPNRVLERVPMVNLHFSLLPRWRGAAPVERALLAGDERTGVCVMDVVEALDEGDVFARGAVEIGAHDTLASLRATLVDVRDRTAARWTGTRVRSAPAPTRGDHLRRQAAARRPAAGLHRGL